jgi:hypothetical protein
MKKKIVLPFVLIMLSLISLGCSSSTSSLERQIIGEWIQDVSGFTRTSYYRTYVFENDGRFISRSSNWSEGDWETGRWEIRDDNSLIISGTRGGGANENLRLATRPNDILNDEWYVTNNILTIGTWIFNRQ